MKIPGFALEALNAIWVIQKRMKDAKERIEALKYLGEGLLLFEAGKY